MLATSFPGFANFNIERDTPGTYIVASPDIGQVAFLRVQLEPKGDNPEGYCREVTVRNPITRQVWVFPIESWLGRSNGPLLVEKLPNN
jgi:hypothetical protein